MSWWIKKQTGKLCSFEKYRWKIYLGDHFPETLSYDGCFICVSISIFVDLVFMAFKIISLTLSQIWWVKVCLSSPLPSDLYQLSLTMVMFFFFFPQAWATLLVLGLNFQNICCCCPIFSRLYVLEIFPFGKHILLSFFSQTAEISFIYAIHIAGQQ